MNTAHDLMRVEPQHQELNRSGYTSTDDLMTAFLSQEDVKPSSRSLYQRTLRQFFMWVKENNLNLNNMDRNNVLDYKQSLLDTGKSALTVSSYITVVRKFYEWAEGQLIYPNIAKSVKSPRRKQNIRKEPLKPDQVKQLLQYYADNGYLRDYAIVSLMVHTGLRTISVSLANIEDIKMRGGKRILEYRSKGYNDKADNWVEIGSKTYKAITAYLETRGATKVDAPLFVSTSNNNQGERMSTRTISFIAKEGLKAIGLDDKVYTAHSLRHTAGTNIVAATGDLFLAQLTLGHSNPATTQVYTRKVEEWKRMEHSGEAVLEELY